MPYSSAAASAADDAPKSSSLPSSAMGLSAAPGAPDGEGACVPPAAVGGGGEGEVEVGGAPDGGVSPPAGLRLRLFFAAS